MNEPKRRLSAEKIRHKVYTTRKNVASPERVFRALIRQAVVMTLRSEDVDVPCVVDVLITNNKTIRQYNKQHRGIDKSTDVLSFPMQEFSGAGWENITAFDVGDGSGVLPLGDIIMSIEQVRRQARVHGHTVERETTYMIIHSTLHLLGYDHMDEHDKKLMRFKEERLMEDMGYLERTGHLD